MRNRLGLILSLLCLWGVAGAQEVSPSPRSSAADSDSTNERKSGVILDDVVVTGTRTEKLLSEVPVRTELVGRDQIDVSAARSVADAVEFTPGVRVNNACQNCGFATLSLLGLEGKYSQVLIDGLPSLSGLALVYGLEHIPAEMIHRIEIVKGGGSSVYGPGAVGGVVNIIPRDPQENTVRGYGRAEDMDGVTNWSSGFHGSIVAEDWNSGLTFFGQADKLSPYDRNGDGFTEVARRDLTAFGVRALRYVGSRGHLTLDYGRVYEDRRGGDQLENPPFMSEIAEWVRTTRDAVTVSWQDRPGTVWDYRLSVSHADTRRDTYYGSGGDDGAYGSTRNPLWVLDGQVNHYLGNHTLSWGLQYQSDALEDEHPAYDRLIDERYENTGGFVQDDWLIAPPLALIVGLRLDKHSALSDPVVSPRAALKYTPATDVSIRGSVATGFLAPQVFDEDLHIEIAGGAAQVIRNADDLKEESSRSYTLGVEVTPALGDGFLLGEVNAFYTELEDAFALTDERDDPLTPEDEFYRINAGGADVYGVEVSTGYMQGPFEGQVGVVLQQAEYDEPQDFDSTDFFYMSETSGVFRLYWRDPRTVDLFVGARYYGKMKVPHYAGYIAEDRLETTPSFLAIDVSLSRAIRVGDDALTLGLGCKNITDDYQDDFDQGPDRDAGYVYGPRLPRTWYVSAKYGF